MAKTVLRIEIARENLDSNGYFYSYLNLPAEDYEIRDALQKARLIGAGDVYHDITIMSNSYFEPLSHVRLDSPTVEELNFLSKRLAAMDGVTSRIYEAVVSSVIKEDEPVSMKDLINCTYGLDEVMVAANVTNDEKLGAFIIENELLEAVNAVPEEALPLLDRAKIGEMYRKTSGTVYTAGLCVFVGDSDYDMPEVYDGKQLPESDNSAWFAFRLRVAEAPKGDEPTDSNAEWISLPMDKSEADRIAALHGESRIEDCVCYGFESSVPQITADNLMDLGDFNGFNRLAAMMAEMSPTDQIKFKAVLAADPKSCHLNIQGLLDVAEHLHLYEMDTAAANDDEFFKRYLAHHLDSRIDSEWLDALLVRAEGGRLLDRLGAAVTDYGAISARGRSLYEIVPYNKLEAKELTTQALTDEKLDVIEVLDRVALFSNGRILPEEVPEGLYAYDLRMDDDNQFFRAIEKKVAVNHGGTILLKEPLVFGDSDCIVMDEESDPNFLGYELTPAEFMQTDFTQTENEPEQTAGQQFGGM